MNAGDPYSMNVGVARGLAVEKPATGPHHLQADL